MESLLYTYIYKYIFILTGHTLQWSCFFNGLSSLKEHKAIIYVLNGAEKCSSEIPHYRGFVRNFGELILRRENVLLNSFNQSRFDVCTVWATENSGQGISFSLREILVTSALKLVVSVFCFNNMMMTVIWTGQIQSSRSFSHCQIPNGVLITGNQAAAWSWIPWLL